MLYTYYRVTDAKAREPYKRWLSRPRYTITGHDLPVTVRAYEAAGDIENESFNLSACGCFSGHEGKCNGPRIVPENREMKVAWPVNGPRSCTKSTFTDN